MIVGDDQPMRVLAQRARDDRAHRKRDMGGMRTRFLADADRRFRGVEIGDQQQFVRAAGEARLEKIGGVARGAKGGGHAASWRLGAPSARTG